MNIRDPSSSEDGKCASEMTEAEGRKETRARGRNSFPMDMRECGGVCVKFLHLRLPGEVG